MNTVVQKIECYPFVNSLFSSVTYILTIGRNPNVWIIDPGDMDSILETVKRRQLVIKGVFLTHGHFDHIYGLNKILQEFPDSKVYTNDYGKKMLESDKLNMSKYHETPYVIEKTEAVVTIADSEKILLDNNLWAKAIFTPGHNPSCITWLISDDLFTGDSYIPGIKTVTNLPGGNKKQAEASINLINKMAVGRTIYPGHKV